MPDEPVDNAYALVAQMAILKTIFRPSSPMDDRDLFKGRARQLGLAASVIEELGQHAVVYGERGVGKTSLAYIAKGLFLSVAPETSIAVRVPLTAEDTFATAWKKFVPRLQVEVDGMEPDAASFFQPLVDRVEDLLDFDDCTPETVARALHYLARKIRLLVIIDEFDRMADMNSTRAFADLIKTLSDDPEACTIFIVGVADSVEQMIQGHQSIERSLKEVAMPRMTKAELRAIVEGGFKKFEERSGVSLKVDGKAVSAVTHLSQGFPYYAHLLAGSLGALALERSLPAIGSEEVIDALMNAVNDATQSIKVSYTEAVAATRSDAQFSSTLLACALAHTDDLGFFTPGAVAAPLSGILHTPRNTSHFLAHLRRFADAPSWILETRGEGRKTRYRFSNPLMKPFVLIKGVQTGLMKLTPGQGFTFN